MTKLELTHHRMFPEEGDPGWHAGRLDDGRRVHAAAMPCGSGELHWAGSVEDATACECDDHGTCNLCLIRQDGGLVFTRVTGCYRSANSAVRALRHWAACPDALPPPAPFDCGWTTMQAVLCENVPETPPMPLGTTEHPLLLRNIDEQPENAGADQLRFDDAEYGDQSGEWRDLMMQQITPESLEECYKSGHPRQAWLILSEQQVEAGVCPACGKVPEFWEKMSGDDRVLTFNCISEIISETHVASHEVGIIVDDPDNVSFRFHTNVFRDSADWPKPGSTDLTRLPYPGDDAVTLQWFRKEWNLRGYLPEDAVLFHPYTKEPLTDETLRQVVAQGHQEGFCYETTAIGVIDTVAREMRRTLAARDGKTCQHCQEPLKKHNTIIERRDPAKGDCTENLHLLCQRCHRVKKDMPWKLFRKDWKQRFGFEYVKRVVDAHLGTDDEQMDEIRLAFRGNADRCRSCRWILVGDYALNEDRHCAHCVVGAPRRLEFQFPPRE